MAKDLSEASPTLTRSLSRNVKVQDTASPVQERSSGEEEKNNQKKNFPHPIYVQPFKR